MFKLFNKRHKRLIIESDNIFIDNAKDFAGKVAEVDTVFHLTEPTPLIKVYENNQLIRQYRIDTLNTNSNLTGQFLHSSIRILDNNAVMIDGIISKSDTSFPKWTDQDYEAIRLQPFFLSNAYDKNIELTGKGLFDRGLHFAGTVTPTNVRCVCICDYCKKSFSLQHFHAGFSELQYFYSTCSRETLLVPYDAISDMPTQIQTTVDPATLKEIESKLPKTSDGDFRYFNSFKCPHCLSAFIDFEKYPEMRSKEYYGNSLINHKAKQWAQQTGSLY
jgi:hypothetical protein